MSEVDSGTADLFQSSGTYEFNKDLATEHEIQERLKAVYKGQNRLVRAIAKAVDEAWPPDMYERNGTAPGDIVRQFLVQPAEEAKNATS